MKKLSIGLILIFVLVALVFVSCSKKEQLSSTYSDGFYFAIESEYPESGWREYVALNVESGKITLVNYSGIDRSGNDKKEYDKSGNYNMVRFGNAIAEWYEQAERLEAYLIQNQNPNLVAKNVDSISGVSISVDEFVSLASKALKNGPLSKGKYSDGLYYAIEDDFDESGWKDYVSVLVQNGNIVDIYWSALDKNNNDKKDYDKSGKYNMVKFGNAQAEWYEQAQRIEQTVLNTQNSSAVDSVSGVSITLSGFFALLDRALNN
jgi:major membrane immunogen (membrane-anchored lipoprotein)